MKLNGILAGNKVHLSEIARSLNENISLKKTIDRLSRNLFAFEEKDLVMENYISDVHDGSTGEIKKGYLTFFGRKRLCQHDTLPDGFYG